MKGSCLLVKHDPRTYVVPDHAHLQDTCNFKIRTTFCYYMMESVSYLSTLLDSKSSLQVRNDEMTKNASFCTPSSFKLAQHTMRQTFNYLALTQSLYNFMSTPDGDISVV